MSIPRISVASTEYVRIPVASRDANGAYDPTGDTVEFALTLKPDSNAADKYNEPSSWTAGVWWTEGNTYYAVTNVGPSGDLTNATTTGTWQLWMKVTSSPEAPVKYVGDVEIF